MSNLTKGIVGVVGIWITAGIALPMVNMSALAIYKPEQLMAVRGCLTALLALLVLRGKVGGVDKATYMVALVLPFATLGLYQGIRHWGAGPTITIITATPIVNFLIALFCKKKISLGAVIALLMMLGGVALARFNREFQWAGFLWTVFGTIMNGILYECFKRAKAGLMQVCFWACAGMGILGILLSLNAQWYNPSPKVLGLLFGFAFVGGFVYWLANLLAFKHLSTDVASVLAQGETPTVIFMAGVLLGEPMSIQGWVGVSIALVSACGLLRSLKEP